MWISPSFQYTDFSDLSSLETKIALFEDSILGWQINIADQIINGKKSSPGNPEILPMKNSQYAALGIVFSYFEMIAKYCDGYKGKGKSRKYFKDGLYLVLGSVGPSQQSPEVIEEVIETLYDSIRCGLYHTSIIGSKVAVTFQWDDALTSLTSKQMPGINFVAINPKILIPKIREHFEKYISQLRDASNDQLRKNFEARYDFDYSGGHVFG